MKKFVLALSVATLTLAAVLHLSTPGPQAFAQQATTATAPASQPAKAVVVIVKGTDAKQMMAQAVKLLGGLEPIVGKAKTITLKPNLTGTMGGQVKGVSTSGEVMEALVGEIEKSSKAKLTIAEGAGAGFRRMLKATGMDKMAKDHDIALVDTTDPKTPRVKVELPDGQAYKSYEYPKVALDADVFIDVPVMKTHQLSGITVGFKNLYGYLPHERSAYHDRCWDVLIDLASIRKPDLIVVDALYGMQGRGPLWGKIVKHDLLIVGTDIVAVDTVCGALMGQPIERIPYTNKAAKLGMGQADLKNIEIRGEKIEDVKKDYEMARWYVAMEVPRTKELVERIQKLCDAGKYDDHFPDGKLFCTVYRFKDTNLKPDLKKYPLRKNTGFEVWMYEGRDTIEFQTRYTLFYEENRAAAEQEMRAWIKENLKDLVKKDPVTLPMGGTWHGRKE